MYASFFGLRELPFNNTPDPRFFFSTPDHEEALASLIYSVTEQKGFVLLTGEVGSGKTLVTRLMLRHFGDAITFAGINNTQISPDELLDGICSEFDIPHSPNASNADLTRHLQDFLLNCFAKGRTVVLMLDEAQALSREALEQVRMIGNLESDDTKLLQIIIVGQPELRQRFEANDMRQLRQRLFRSFHLPALDREQTKGYILHRLGVAGAQHVDEVFDEDAIEVIYEYSQGLPRLINTVCDNAMLSAYAADQHRIDGPAVHCVVKQMMTVSQGGPKYASPVVPPANAEMISRPPADHAWNLAANVPTCLRCGAATLDPLSDLCHNCINRSIARARRMHDEVRVADQLQPAVPADNAANHLQFAEMNAARRAEQLRELTYRANKMLHKNQQLLQELHEAARCAAQTRDAARTALKQLAIQAARTGRLSIALREVFDKLESRAQRLMSQSQTQLRRPHTAPSQTRSPEVRILEKSRRIDQSIRNNRRTVEDVKSLISATSGAQVVAEADDHEIIDGNGPSLDSHSPASQLARQVAAISRLVDETRGSRPVSTPA